MARAYKRLSKSGLKGAATLSNPLTAKTAGLLASTAKWLLSLNPDVAMGYEDEEGFHFGPAQAGLSAAPNQPRNI